MSWQLLEQYDQQAEDISPSCPAYNQKISTILRELCNEHFLEADEAMELSAVIITRNKLKSKEIVNENISKLNSIFEAETYTDLSAFKQVYYDCLCNRDIPSVENYIDEHTARQNYQYELCTRCNPNAKIVVPATPVPEVSKESLKAMFCLHSVMGQYRDSQFLHFTTKRAFLPEKGSNARCNISDIPPNVIFQKVKQVLTKKLGYSVVESDPSLFYHSQNGLALVSRWEILVYSMNTEKVKALLSDHFLWTFTTDNFTFMGYKIDINKNMLVTNWYDYTHARFSKMFSEYGLSNINSTLDYPTGGYFEYLENPPNGDPHLIDKRFITRETKYGGLKCRRKEKVSAIDLRQCRSMIEVLNYIAWNFRWDLQYYAAVLSRYTKNPNDIVYNALMDIFRYINSTRNFSTMYKPLPKNADMRVDIYTDGHFKAQSPNTSYSGFIINICKRYWHSKSKRIVNKVEDEFVAALCAAHDAVEYIALSQSVLKTLEQYSKKYIEYVLNVENDLLYAVLTKDSACVLSASWRKRLVALNGWMSEYPFYITHIDGSKNPASILTRDSNSARDYLFDHSPYVKYVDEGYEPSSDSSDGHMS